VHGLRKARRARGVTCAVEHVGGRRGGAAGRRRTGILGRRRTGWK
jgi:hypothetical protein